MPPPLLEPARPAASRRLCRVSFWPAWVLALGLTGRGQAADAEPPNPIPASEATAVRVNAFRFEAADTNRPLVFSTNVLAALVAEYAGRELGDAELEAARRRITEHYVAHGYLNSGALLPDQDVAKGVVTFLIVEGRLSEIYVHGTRRLKPKFARRRLEVGVPRPLNLDQLGDALNTLRLNPNVDRMTADIQPVRTNGAVVLGQSILDLQIEEARPYHLELQIDNYQPPSVGAELMEILASCQNLTGNSDVLALQYGLLQRGQSGGVAFAGLDNLGVAYSLPVTARDTTLGAFYDRRDYAVVQEPFNQLDIQSSYYAYGLRVQQPLYRGRGHSVSAGLSLERRHSESFLLGEPFSFSSGTLGGEADVTVLRLNTEWTRSWVNQNLMARLTTSLGLDAWGATRLPLGADGRFVSVLGQWQYIRRLNSGPFAGALGDSQLVFRGGFQWADDPLLAMEQFSLGGINTVRGYIQNQLVRDTGVFASVELRVPVIRGKSGGQILQVVHFFDFGAGWDVGTRTPEPTSISGVGLGLILNVAKRLNARFDWGYPLRDVPNTDDSLQGLGLYFQVGYAFF